MYRDVAAYIGADQNLNVLDFVLQQSPNNLKFSAMFWGFITYQGVRTFTEVEGNINSWKYINILNTYLLPVIARHFPFRRRLSGFATRS
jgi:hypothetical protein